MSKTLLVRTLIASTLVIVPATAAAQTSPADEEASPTEETAQRSSDQGGQSPEMDDETDNGDAGDDEPDDDSETTESDSSDAEQTESSSSAGQQESDEPQSEQSDEPQPDDEQQVEPLPGPGDQEESTGEGTAPENDDGNGEDESPISGISDGSDDGGFEPVSDIEETELQEITPAEVYPYLEWEGLFRTRSTAAANFDLGTGGTSAILPPAENNLPAADRADREEPANASANLLWTTDMNLRLDPTIHITENLRVHIEANLLENVVLGSLSDRRLTPPGSQPFYRPDPSRTVFESNQVPPREREWFENSLQINEVWGEIDTFLGSFRAGRMDNDWGLGLHANGGDCLDCNYGDHVDRLEFMTKPLGVYASAAIDFPDQGATTQTPQQIDDQPYDVSQVDDARQYTFSIFREPRTEKDKQIRQQKLKDEQVPVVDGGARFTLRNQKGLAVPGSTTDGTSDQPFQLVYRGLDMYVPDIWAEVKYNPEPDTYVQVGLEAVGVFGSIDNTTANPVGTGNNTEQGPTNCFDQEQRDGNSESCTQTAKGESTDTNISQLGAALESELYFGGPVRFGLNAGYASGGDSPNWGYQSPSGNASGLSDLDFYRFDPNYHVDLILFREVLGSVTNAYYANPYAQARFFESSDQRMEVQLDAIASRVANSQGTPAQEGNWLGVELDGAVRYLQVDRFQAELEGGVLFPFEPLAARIDNPRLTQPVGTTDEEFQDDVNPSIAWTIQSNLSWQF